MDVSRETALAVFGDRLPLAEAYAELLATAGVGRGLIGPREASRLWSRHLLNSAVVAEACPAAGLVVDVGSGAGLPGLPVAIARPQLAVRLVEPLHRRVTFLVEAVATLGLDNVEVVRARAEELHGQWTAPVVTARAVAPLDRLASWCLPLVSPGGSLLAIKGERAEGELAGAEPVLRRMRAVRWSVERVGVGVVDPPVRIVRIVAGSGSVGGRPHPRGRGQGVGSAPA
jgi:16S rRNA (guanine527-N7)-methyltransferase